MAEELDGAPGLDDGFFAEAILTLPGESLVETVQAARGTGKCWPHPSGGFWECSPLQSKCSRFNRGRSAGPPEWRWYRDKWNYPHAC